jgi:hypothetical protein
MNPTNLSNVWNNPYVGFPKPIYTQNAMANCLLTQSFCPEMNSQPTTLRWANHQRPTTHARFATLPFPPPPQAIAQNTTTEIKEPKTKKRKHGPHTTTNTDEASTNTHSHRPTLGVNVDDIKLGDKHKCFVSGCYKRFGNKNNYTKHLELEHEGRFIVLGVSRFKKQPVCSKHDIKKLSRCLFKLSDNDILFMAGWAKASNAAAVQAAVIRVAAIVLRRKREADLQDIEP